MRTLLVSVLLIVLTGCANTSSVRIIEYGGGGAFGLLAGGIGGCSTLQSKGSDVFAEVSVSYIGDKCSVEVRIGVEDGKRIRH